MGNTFKKSDKVTLIDVGFNATKEEEESHNNKTPHTVLDTTTLCGGEQLIKTDICKSWTSSSWFK